MPVHTEASIGDLYRVPGKAEIVDGELRLMSPTGALPGRAALEIAVSLHGYSRQTKSGFAYGDNVGFVVKLPRRQSFSPDAAYYVGPDSRGRFVEGAPVFAVEVRSEGDYGAAAEREMAAKRADYFAAGTLVVWDVDVLKAETIRVFRTSDPLNPTVYSRGQLAEAEPALPGWTFPVEDLFR